MSKIKTFLIIFGDIVLLYGALILTLIFRYGLSNLNYSLLTHLKPFSLIFLLWLLTFYLADLYKDKNLKTAPMTAQVFILAIAISVAASIIFFYLFPDFFKLTPKTNLFIFALVFGILDFSWRLLLVKIYITSGWRNRLLIIGDSKVIDEITLHLKNNPQIGYDIAYQIKEYSPQKTDKEIDRLIAKRLIDAVVIPPHLKKNLKLAKLLYKYLHTNIAVVDLITFYETIFQKLPIEELEESWFIEKITSRHYFYDILKRILDILMSLILMIILSPIILLITILTKLSSRQGPAIYRQERIGLNDKSFILFKFGIMKADQGSPWTLKNDKRLTGFGKFINYTHLNEIPQLFNILKGDISFIGPRPESKQLAEIYRQIPYYEIRHVIKPGLTGWAQLNYKASASLEEAKEKLQYDLYYVKNRSLVLDFLILLKTIKYVFVSQR